MTQMMRVSGRSTDIYTDENGTHVTYHGTRVVSFNDKEITLRSGGWQSYTTKARMNQAANQFNLKFSVYQERSTWFVNWRGTTTLFRDGMVLPRSR